MATPRPPCSNCSSARLPPRRGFLLAAGLEQALDFLENLRFSAADIAWLESTGRFGKNLLDYLAGFPLHRRRARHGRRHRVLRQRADPARDRAAAAGAIRRIAPDQHPALSVAGRRKAARMVLAAPNKLLVDFGMRRAHGAEAGLMAARASYIAGFAGTATVLAGEKFGIPLYGTMAHSFIEAFDDETAAFESFRAGAARQCRAAARHLRHRSRGAQSRGAGAEAQSGRHRDPRRAPRFRRSHRAGAKACAPFSMPAASRRSRFLPAAASTRIRLLGFARADAPIDGIGIGTSLTTSPDVPSIDCVYKLQDYAGCRGASARRTKRPGPAASRCGGATTPTAGWPAICCRCDDHRHGRRAAHSPGDARRPAHRAVAVARRRSGVTPSANSNGCRKHCGGLSPAPLSGRGRRRSGQARRGGRPPHEVRAAIATPAKAVE